MDSLGNYDSSDDDKDPVEKNVNRITTITTTTTHTISNQSKEEDEIKPVNRAEFKTFSSFKANLSPVVTDDIRVLENRVASGTAILAYNPTVQQLYGDSYGPSVPFKTNTNNVMKNHVGGNVENVYIDNYSFSEQFHRYNSSLHESESRAINNSEEDDSVAAAEKKKRKYEDPSNVAKFKGTWGDKREIVLRSASETKSSVDVGTSESGESLELTEEQQQYLDSKLKRNKTRSDKEVPEQTAEYHNVRPKKDYMGRAWYEPPSDLKAFTPDETYMPKNLVHTWTGHSKGVSAIRFFPEYAHLLLSSSMDSTIKIWDVLNERACLQTYTGHREAVRDICFSNDGRRFLSAGFDRVVRLWDTETGQIIGSYTNGRSIPYCVKFNPDDDKQNIFLVGGSDNKILQYDVKSNEAVQEYSQHLGAINTITFIDGNKRFVTSSDDKSIRIWDWGIPFVIKYISDPTMHSMPAITVHPSGKWFATQSLDNQILVYSTTDKFRMNKKKRYQGHIVSGYACQFSFSPDGKYLVSGDSTGKTYFWDWKSCKLLKTMPAHSQVCIDAEWNPNETSKIATCSWDGKIKYWE